MGGAYGAYKTKEKCLQGVCRSYLQVREHLNGLDIDGRMILMLFFSLNKMVWETIYWFCPAREGERWWAAVNATMNSLVSSNAAIL
jgi:hypothetical protein